MGNYSILKELLDGEVAASQFYTSLETKVYGPEPEPAAENIDGRNQVINADSVKVAAAAAPLNEQTIPPRKKQKPAMTETYTPRQNPKKANPFGAFVSYLKDKEANQKTKAATSYVVPKTDIQAAIVLICDGFDNLTPPQKYKLQQYFMSNLEES